jgi:hypothetical protein
MGRFIRGCVQARRRIPANDASGDVAQAISASFYNSI